MTDGLRHANNGSEVAASKVEERALLESKPILEWTRDDWQLWAAGLDQSQDEPVQPEPVQPEPVALQDPVQPEPVDLGEPVQPGPVVDLYEPVQPEPVRPAPVQAEPVQAEPVQAEPVQAEPVQSEPVQSEPVQSEPIRPDPAPEPAPVRPETVRLESVRHEPAPAPVPTKADASVDLAAEATVDAEAPTVDAPTVDAPTVDARTVDVPPTETPTVETASATSSVTSELTARDVAVEVPRTPASPRPEPSAAALRLSPDLSATRPWPGRRPEPPVRTAARTRARSALGLMVLALVVGTAVAGLVTFVVIVVSLVLRRALGA